MYCKVKLYNMQDDEYILEGVEVIITSETVSVIWSDTHKEITKHKKGKLYGFYYKSLSEFKYTSNGFELIDSDNYKMEFLCNKKENNNE